MYLLHKVAEKLSAEILFAEIMMLTFKAVNGTGLAWPLAWSQILFLEMGVVKHRDRLGWSTTSAGLNSTNSHFFTKTPRGVNNSEILRSSRPTPCCTWDKNTTQ
jgi:hypothetical protein